jgi:hypothetical protein
MTPRAVWQLTSYIALSLLGTAFFASAEEGAQNNVFVSHPTACFSIGSRTQAFPYFSSLPETLRKVSEPTKTVTKYDVFCVADEFTIDSPIYSNGGDVFILARVLKLRAIIDTRVFRPYDFKAYFMDPPTTRSPRLGLPFFNILDLIDPRHGPLTKQIEQFFEEYYACIECRELSSGVRLIPRLPDGASPPMLAISDEIYHGDPPLGNGVFPPGGDFDEFRSGSVHIFADQITIDTNDTGPSKILVDVRGLPGGLGGAGAPSPCVSHWEDPPQNPSFSCMSTNVAGVSAGGGVGGDAGNIYVASPRTPPETLSLLRDHSNFAGGLAGTVKMYRSPLATIPPTAFVPTGESWPDLPDGRAGDLIVSRVDRADLLPNFLRAIQVRSAFTNYDLGDLAQRAQSDRSIAWLTPEQYVAAAVDSDIRRVYTLYTGSVGNASDLVPRSGQAIIPASVFCPAKLPDEELTDELKLFLAILRPTCGADDQHKRFAEFLLSSGGIANIRDWNVIDRLDKKQIKAELRENAETWTKMVLALQNMNDRLFSIYGSVERTRLEAVKDRLSNRLDKLEELRSQAAQKNNSFIKLLTTAVQMAGPANSFLAVVGQLSRGDQQFDQLSKAGKYGSELYDQFSKTAAVFNDLTHSPQNPSDDEEKKLRSELQATLSDIQELARTISEQKDANRRDIEAALADNLLARSRYGRTSRNGIGLFEDLIRVVTLSTMFDPEGQLATADRNIASLKLFISDFPTGTFQFQVRPFEQHCTKSRHIAMGVAPSWLPFSSLFNVYRRHDEDCIMFDAGNRELLIYAQYQQPSGAQVEVPIFRAGANSGRHEVPLFSFLRYRMAEADGAR